MLKVIEMKRKLFSLLLVLCFVFACVCGCSASNKVALKVGDREVTLRDIETAYQNYLSQYSSYISVTDEDSRVAFVDYVVENIINSEMEQYQASVSGITLTDEELAACKTSAEAEYQEAFEQYVSYAEQQGATDVRATANKYFTELLTQNGMTINSYKERLLRSAKESKISEKFQAMIAEEAQVTDEQLKEAYEAQAESQKETFDADPTEFYTYLDYSAYGYYCRPVYIPAGMVRAKVILVLDSNSAEEIVAKLNEGADFDELYKEYNEGFLDDDAIYADGYLFCMNNPFDMGLTDYILTGLADGEYTKFTTDIMQLEESGYFAVAQRICTEEGRVLDYDTTIDSVRDYLEYLIQNSYYSDKMAAWCSDTSLVTKYESVYANVGK